MPRWLFVVPLLLGLGPYGIAVAPSPAVRQGATPFGVTFTLPSTWSMEQRLWLIVLRPPEADLRVVIVEVGRAPNAVMAAGAAWSLYRVQGLRALAVTASRGPHHGWDEARRLDYTTGPGQEGAACAVAFRRGARFSVLILEGSQATASKHRDEIRALLESVLPARF